MKAKKKKVVLLDAHAIIHRAYHALPDFVSQKGEPTGALYGLSSMLLKIINDLKPDYVIACYDLPEATFRHVVYKDYKAGRPKADDELIKQLERSRDVFAAYNIPIYDAPGFEADDILGTIVEQLKDDKDADIIIASGDLDTLQLVTGKKVQVYTLRKGLSDTILYDEKAVIARYGFDPTLLPDYKGLRGDPSDNIIGIRGIGEKTATQLISNFGTIENIYKTIKKDSEELEKVGIKPRIINLLREGEEEALFSKTLGLIRRDAPITFSYPEKVWRESVDEKNVEKLYIELSFRTLLDRFKKVLHEGDEVSSPREEKNPPAGGEEKVDPIEFKKVALAVWLLNSDLSKPSLTDILEYTHTTLFKEAVEVIKKEIKEKNLEFVFTNIELPIIPIVEQMEKRGVQIDVEFLKKLSKEYHKKLEIIRKKIYTYSDGEFNINSPKQLGEILFDKLQLWAKGLKKSAGGARSTRISELEKLIDVHPIIKEIISYRELQKLLSTYIDPIPTFVDKDNRLHADFIQTGTTTGRFASANPNLQNIPIRGDLGKKIRNGFVAAPGHTMVAFDYSQIDFRVMAMFSEDTYLREAFMRGDDIHTAVAARVFEVSEDNVTSDMRRKAKVINFGIMYGMGVVALQKNLGSTRAEAKKFHDEYFESFPSIQTYIENIKALSMKQGFSETLFERRRYFPDIKSKLPFKRAAAERMAMNFPIQGTSADIFKLAMKDAHGALVDAKLIKDAHLILQVHDELVYEIKNEAVEKATKVIKEAMEEAIPKKYRKGKKDIPMLVNVESGPNWGEMKVV